MNKLSGQKQPELWHARSCLDPQDWLDKDEKAGEEEGHISPGTH